MHIINIWRTWRWLEHPELSGRHALQIVALVALSLAVSAFSSPGAQFSPVVRLSTPVGVATDANGNIFISHDMVSETRVTKFSPEGESLGHVTTGGFIDIGALGSLARMASTGVILHLQSTGKLIAIDPDNLAAIQLLDIRTMEVDTSAIYDVTSGEVGEFGGLIQTQFATFGDLAIHETPESLDLFITGMSQAQTFPFIMRISVLEDTVEARVLMSSRADALALERQAVRLTRGIAVNDEGTVLTSLPVATPPPGEQFAVRPFDVLMAFDAGFDPSDGIEEGEEPRIILGPRTDVYSQGMTTDANGNFYVTTNSTGSAALGVPGEGALVILPATLDQAARILSLGQMLTSFRGVAVTLDGSQAYVTVQLFGVGQTSGLVMSTPLDSG